MFVVSENKSSTMRYELPCYAAMKAINYDAQHFTTENNLGLTEG